LVLAQCVLPYRRLYTHGAVQTVSYQVSEKIMKKY
jgi:hypothetical protein